MGDVRTNGVTRRLTPRHRRTRLGLDGGRTAGFYEQSGPSPKDTRPASMHRGTHPGSLLVSGLMDRPGSLGQHVLRSLAGSGRLSDFDSRVISIADLLCECRLDVAADVIMWEGVDGSRLATPVSRLFDEAGSTLLLGGPDQTGRPTWTSPVVLRSPGLTGRADIEVVALSAMTFAQFIGADR